MIVVNKYHYPVIPPEFVSLMRPGPLGNPFAIGRDGSRSEVVAMHMTYARQKIERDPIFRAAVKSLKDRTCYCVCKPLDCHGDNLKILCEELNNGS